MEINLFICEDISFNTSHVVVYPIPENYFVVNNCFNTSHVVVYQLKQNLHLWTVWCFNTSHVVVYHQTGINLNQGI